MSVKQFFLKAALLGLPFFSIEAQSYYYPVEHPVPPSNRGSGSFNSNRSISSQDNDPFKQIKNALADVKHELSNHESEIRTFENKLITQESIMEHLRQQVVDDIQGQKEYTRATMINLEGQVTTLDHSIKNLDNAVKGVIQDIRQMKAQANDSVAALNQYKQKLSEMEKLIEAQNQHMHSLEAALHSMMDIIQVKEVAITTKEPTNKTADTGKTYKVQSGDSLEKIARAHKVTIQALKDYNNLTSDRIIVGQTLKIP